MTFRHRAVRHRPAGRSLAAGTALAALVALVPAAAAQAGPVQDPRQGLAPGTQSQVDGAAFTEPLRDAETVEQGLDLLAERSKPAYAGAAGAFNYSNINSDVAFAGDLAFSGSYRGFGIYDVSDPAAPALRTTVNCPGGQGDVSVVGDLLFMSVEGGGRVDCSASGPADAFRGVRVFDVSDPDNPVNIVGVQTCRGSHTHTVVTKPGVTDRLWVYVSGTAGIRPAAQLAGCAPASTTDPSTSAYRIDVIEVPLAAPETARVVSGPRLMSACGSSACVPGSPVATLNPGGVQPLYPVADPRATGGQRVSATSACHDITAYPAIGLAAGACQGDGLLLDISDPVNPVRIDSVTDNNFAYWHSATFNDDGTKVVFTDEWGGGTGARCRPTDPDNWGADAIFDVIDTPTGKQLEFASYYKIPNVQADNETCVAHNANLVPVPGRDVMVQAWYEGGVSVFDFTDSAAPKEIAFFDRGPYDDVTFHQGGYWSAYWYNGEVYGNEIFLGLDVFGLTPGAALSADEVEAARLADVPELNAQLQQPFAFAPSFPLVGARFDQAVRSGALSKAEGREIGRFVERAEKAAARGDVASAEFDLRTRARQLRSPAQQPLRVELLRLADSF